MENGEPEKETDIRLVSYLGTEGNTDLPTIEDLMLENGINPDEITDYSGVVEKDEIRLVTNLSDPNLIEP